MSSSSQREHKRIEASISVKVRCADGRRPTAERIRNISLGGVFIEMKDPLPFGTDVELEFELPIEPRVVRCRGFVVWSTKSSPTRGDGMQGVGVRLMDIGVREMRTLNEFIEVKLKSA